MKILLLFFSGTYNTLYISTLIKNRLVKDGHEVSCEMINKDSRVRFNEYDLVGIGYPIHAFNAPLFLERFLKKAKMKNKNYFIYKTSGEPFVYNDASSLKIIKILKEKDNNFLAEYHFLMPYNILFRTKEEFISYEMEYNLKYIDYMCKNLLNKKELKANLLARVACFVFKIQRIGININIKHYKANRKVCAKCRQCQMACPTHNIRYDKRTHRLVFGNNCTMCMRCSFMCPTDAISIGLINKYKVNGPYDLIRLTNSKSNYDISKETQRFYKKFKPYFSYIDSLVLKENEI